MRLRGIQTPVVQQGTVILTDVNGRKVHESTERTNAVVEIEKPLAAGVYLLRVTSGGQSKILRVAKVD